MTGLAKRAALLALAALVMNHAQAFTPVALQQVKHVVTPSSPSAIALSMATESEPTTDQSIPYDAAARLAYDEWRTQYNKGAFDAARYEIFKVNYKAISVANSAAKKKAREAGEDKPRMMKLNEYGDCTAEEYKAMQKGGGTSVTTTGDVLGKAVEASQSQSEASSALADAAEALAEEEEKLAKQLGLENVDELEAALDAMDGIAADGGELEKENIAREARVRSAYLDWCKEYGKEPEEERFKVFSSNFLTMEQYAAESGKEMNLNEFADCTEAEYMAKANQGIASATVVSEEDLAAEAAAKEAEEAAAAEAAKARSEAEQKAAEEAAAAKKAADEAAAKAAAEIEAREQAKADEIAKRRAEEAALAAMDDKERKAAIEKERNARQKAQNQAAQKAQLSAEAEAIRLARETAEREAAQVAKRQAFEAEAAELARKQAEEAEKKRKQMEQATPTRYTAPQKASPGLGAFFQKKPAARQPVRAKAPAPRKAKPAQPSITFPLRKTTKPAKPSITFPLRKTTAAKKPAPKINFSLGKPAPKKQGAKMDLGSFLASKPAQKKAPARKVAPVRKPAAAAKKSDPFSLFASKPAPKKAAPAPVRKPAPAAKKSAPMFSFGSKPAPTKKVAPAPKPAPVAKKQMFSFGAKAAPKKAAPAPAPVAKKEPFSLFGSKAPRGSPTVAIPRAKEVAPKKAGFSLFGGGSSTTTAAAPNDGIPVLSRFTQNADGSLTGFVSNSKGFRNGTKITTSPVRRGVKAGDIVRTGSGSKYRLQ